MRTPQLTADRSVYRSRRTYRGIATGLSADARSVVMADLAGWCCTDDMHCIYCTDACAATSHGLQCITSHVTQEAEPTYLMALAWPYHCLSGDHHHEVYCQAGCAAGDHTAFCLPTHVAETETQPVYLKA